MESWRKVWREGVAPQISTAGLQALARAMIVDDERLVQGSTTTPPPLQCMQECAVEGACGVGFCAWQGDGLRTVGQVEEFFARVCYETDQHFGEPTACRWFLNWFDDTPREEMRRLLLSEVQLALAERSKETPAAAPDETAAA
jgi:hypothetical protein